MNAPMETVFGLLGGLAVFLFGMNMMSEGLQKAAGRQNEVHSFPCSPRIPCSACWPAR
ncbi:hypothetical protein [Paraeggerthella sp.]|uniref:hypothetical protein n=1 Tax=Paraeggerthella sp. TaxID=2897350 RepID=UPI003528B445